MGKFTLLIERDSMAEIEEILADIYKISRRDKFAWTSENQFLLDGRVISEVTLILPGLDFDGFE